MLNPLRGQSMAAGLAAGERSSAFASRAEAELTRFRTLRRELEEQVHQGDLTVKVARERARGAAAEARANLERQAEEFSPTPRAFLDRLVAVSEARRQARDGTSLEALQRETNRLLRQSVIELQLAARAGEFEGRTQVRPLGGGTPAPTLESLLDLARRGRDGGDEVAAEWSRRQLEIFRAQVTDPAEVRRIDLATDRPDAVNPRLVGAYVDAVAEQGSNALATFVGESLASGDANACVAAFALVRQLDPDAADPMARDATRRVLAGLDRFPDAALRTLRSWEADARAEDQEGARAQVARVSASLDTEARLPGLEPPTAEAIERHQRWASRPAVQPGEAMGLNAARRGPQPIALDPAPSPSPETTDRPAA